MAPRNAEHILAQLLRNKSILNHETIPQAHRIHQCSILPSEYIGVSFIFLQGRRRCKDIIKLGRITTELIFKFE